MTCLSDQNKLKYWATAHLPSRQAVVSLKANMGRDTEIIVKKDPVVFA